MTIFENGQVNMKDFTLIQSHVNNVDGYTLSQDDIAKVDFNNDSTITTDTITQVMNNIFVKPVSDESVEPSLFISEYCEGTGNTRYLEFFNPTDSDISLDDYAFPTVVDAPTTTGEYEFWNSFTSGATIRSKRFYIIANPSADDAILRKANQTYTYFSNGNDGLKLVKKITGTTNFQDGAVEGTDFEVIDTLGDWQGDPGSGWSVGGVSNATKDHTLIRKPNVTKGNSDWDASRGTNIIDSEWYVRKVDSIFNIMTHEMDGVVYPLPYQFADLTELKTAVNLWISDKSSALSKYGDIYTWDTSLVTDMSDLFKDKTTFNDDISSWDTSNVTNMDSMFFSATAFNQSVSNFDTSNVTNMGSMFRRATAFNQSLSSFDTSNVPDMSNMFFGATAFNQSLSNFDTSKVTTMYGMFRRASNFNQDIRDWNISSLNDKTNMFFDATEMINAYTGESGFGNTPDVWFWNSHEQAPTLTDITIEEKDGQTIYNVELKDYATIYVDGASKDDLSYNLIPPRSMKVNTENSTFTIPDTSSWTPFNAWTYYTSYNISLGSDTFTLGPNTHSSIWAGGNGRIVFGNGYDYTETISEFLAGDMICACWDMESGGSAFWIIENNQFKIYADTHEFSSSAAIRKYIITLNLDSHSEPGSVSFEYGNMDGTGAQSYYGARDGIIGISYGTNNTETLSASNIDYLEPATNVNFNSNQPIMQQFFHNANAGQGTDQLANKKITFTNEISSLNGVSITGSTLTLDSTAITSQKFNIKAIQNEIIKESNAATITWQPKPEPEPEPEASNEVTFYFKESTGVGIQLSEIKFYDENENELSVVSTEKPATNADGTTNNLKITRPNEDIDKAFDDNISNKWFSNGTYGSVKIVLSDIPYSYTLTTANDNNPYNRTPNVWDATCGAFVNNENHTGEQYYTSDTQQNLFTLPVGTKYPLQGVYTPPEAEPESDA